MSSPNFNPATAPAVPATGAWGQFAAALTARKVAMVVLAALLVALAFNPMFVRPFPVLLGRTLFVGILLLLAFTAAGVRPWGPLPRWLAQVLALGLTAPAATLLLYLVDVRGNLDAFLDNPARVTGFVWLTLAALAVGAVLGLGSQVRERDAQARNQALEFELENARLQRQVLDARLSLLHSQIEPHFLFNTLANVQALVEQGSPRAGPVLQSLISYLKAAMPRLHNERASLGDEARWVTAYLELMHMRMPDRLQWQVSVPAELALLPFPPMALLTLVENAVRHGIDPAVEGGRIEVGARTEAGALLAWVQDTGVGMQPQASAGTGWANLRERLSALYGPQAQLNLQPLQPHGLRAELSLPGALPSK